MAALRSKRERWLALGVAASAGVVFLLSVAFAVSGGMLGMEESALAWMQIVLASANGVMGTLGLSGTFREWRWPGLWGMTFFLAALGLLAVLCLPSMNRA